MGSPGILGGSGNANPRQRRRNKERNQAFEERRKGEAAAKAAVDAAGEAAGKAAVDAGALTPPKRDVNSPVSDMAPPSKGEKGGGGKTVLDKVGARCAHGRAALFGAWEARDGLHPWLGGLEISRETQ